ncbi:MAG: RIO1 family regulatory kinase/ATPase [Anaeromyxobacteraceae bacterium]
MNDPLGPLLADGVIDEIVGRLKSGKEADVWLVRTHGEVAAAKVYKARHVRSFRNDAAYREGRQVRNTRTQRAMDKGSRFGQAASEDAWKAKESDALHRLHAAGVRVPRPVIFYEGVLVMELVLDAHGQPAPRLVDAPLGREQGAALYADLRRQATAMLASDLIHGDLSPYNVLAGAAGPVVIDFPQVVDAAQNSQAERFFLRDLENVRRFCEALDPALRAAESEGREIWRAYVRRELTADFVPTGRVPAQGGHRQGQQAQQGQPHHPRHSQPQQAKAHPQKQRPQGQRPAQPPARPQQGPRPAQQGARPPQQGQRPQQQGQRPQQQGQRPQQAQRSQQPQRPPQRGTPPAPEVIRVQRLGPQAPRQGGGHGQGGQGHGGHGHGGRGHGGHGHGGHGHGGHRKPGRG